MEAGLVGFCGLTSVGIEDFLALLARLGLGVSGWVGSIQAEEEVEEEEEGEVVKGLFIKKNSEKKENEILCVWGNEMEWLYQKEEMRKGKFK